MMISRCGKWILLLCLGIVSLPLAGCWDRKEINDLALVTAAGIDKTDEEMIELSVQVFVPRSGGGGQLGQTGGTGSGPQSLVRSAAGKTVAEAMARLQERIPRTIFWGHTEVFIFGEATAKAGIREVVDFMLRFTQPRERANMFVSKGEAKKIIELIPPLERSQAEVLRELSNSKIGINVTVKQLAEMLIGDAGNAALPFLELLPPSAGGGQQNTIAYITGTAVFRKDKMVGQISDQATRGLLWLRDETKYAVVTIAPKEADGYVTFNLQRSKTELIPHIEDGRWSMTVKIKTEDDIAENTTRLNLMDPELIQSLEKELEQMVIQRVNMALEKVQKEMKTDIFGFAEAFHRKYPHEWQRMKDGWDDKFPNVSVTVEAEAKILRPGKSGPIVNLSKDEMLNP